MLLVVPMTTDFKAIVARDAHSFSIAVAPTPAMEDRRALIAMVREAVWLIDHAIVETNTNGPTVFQWYSRRDYFLGATREGP